MPAFGPSATFPDIASTSRTSIPVVDGGRFPVKRIVGEPVRGLGRYLSRWPCRARGRAAVAAGRSDKWFRVPMPLHDNDRWRASFTPHKPGRYVYAIEAWTDVFATWRRDFLAKRDAGMDVSLELEEGRSSLGGPEAQTSRAGAPRWRGLEPADLIENPDAALVRRARGRCQQGPAVGPDPQRQLSVARRPPDRARRRLVRNDAAQPVVGPGPARHLRRLHRIALPDIAATGLRRPLSHAHPSDRPHQPQGPQQFAASRSPAIPAAPMRSARPRAATTPSIPSSARSTTSGAWCAACAEHGMEIALDFAVQCSPDHPWLAQHPEWFKPPARRLDSIRRKPAEEIRRHRQSGLLLRRQREALWVALRDVVLFWVEQGVRIFRVDNPHTKPFPFWEWLIREVQTRRSQTSSSCRRPSPGRR